MPRVKLKLPRSWRFRSKKQFLFMLPAAIIVLIALSGASYAFFINGGSGPAASANSVNLSKGLVGEWKMDGNMKDSTPNGNDGAASNITVAQGPIMATVGNQGSISASWPKATTTGDTLVAIVTINNGYSTPTAPSGWVTRSGSGGWGTSVYEITNSPSRSGTETFNFSGGNDGTIWLLELSGVSTTTPDDVTSTYSGTSAPVLGPVSVGPNAGIAFAVADSEHGGNVAPITTSGWAQSGGYRAQLGYRLVNGSQSVSATLGFNQTYWEGWRGVVFSFNAASPPGVTSVADRKNADNHAYNLNGSSGSIGVYSSRMPAVNAAQTMSVWFYPKSGSGTQALISLLGSGVGNQIVLNSGLLRMTEFGGTGTNGTSVSLNTWHMATYTYDGSSCRLYLDGQQVASATACVQTGASNYMVLGSDGPGEWFNGSLDDARIYNRAITADEAKALYNSYDDPLDIGQGEKGLVGWWKLDGNLNDATPYNTNCTAPTGSPSFVPDRKSNTTGAMSPPKLGLDCGQPTALQVSTVTMSSWVNPTSWNTSGNGIESYGGTVQLFFGSSGDLRFIIHDSLNQAHTFISPSTYATGSWYHVAATYDGSTVNLYVNGTQVYSTSYTGGIGTNHYGDSGNDFMIGEYNAASTTKYFKGGLDDIRLYNHALSPTEIQQQYSSYNSQIFLGGSGQAGSISLGKGLVGFWPMNGNAKDATPYGDNGTVNGATLTTDRKGRANSAYSFDGTTQSISVSASNLPMKAISVAAWVNQSTLANWYDIVGNHWVTEGGWDLWTDANGQLSFGVYHTGEQNAAYCALGSFSTGTWHYIVGTFDGSVTAVYLDGEKCPNTGAVTGVTLGTAGTFQIGARRSGLAQHTVDDVRIYNRALSANEVQALYQEYQ